MKRTSTNLERSTRPRSWLSVVRSVALEGGGSTIRSALRTGKWSTVCCQRLATIILGRMRLDFTRPLISSAKFLSCAAPSSVAAIPPARAPCLARCLLLSFWENWRINMLKKLYVSKIVHTFHYQINFIFIFFQFQFFLISYNLKKKILWNDGSLLKYFAYQ